MSKGRILSGSRPTGLLHLGNYFGALQNWVKLQNEYDCWYFIADWHALTTGYEDTSSIKANSLELVIDYLAAGLDPKRCVIFKQSDVKEHAELHLLLSMIVPLSWLQRCPTYKDQMKELKDKNIATYGFLGYPCLQAADILLYKADFVPVGEDQLPHLELVREIVRRFNYLYSEVFPIPNPLLTKAKVVPGTDGRKMSKSYNNTILLSDSPEEVRKKISMMVTDPDKIKMKDPGHPDICSVYAFNQMLEGETPRGIENECGEGKIGCVECKKRLADRIVQEVEPIYKRRQEFSRNPDEVSRILKFGSEKAREAAQKTMDEVRRVMKI